MMIRALLRKQLRELGCLCYRPLSEYITEEMGLGQDGGAG